METRVRRIVVVAVVMSTMLMVLGSITGSGGFCPDCHYCPPDYSEKIGWAECSECETDQCWILWPLEKGWPWNVNIADHMKIPGTNYTCWDTTTCIDDDCLPLACEM